jgi:hypothetical protein
MGITHALRHAGMPDPAWLTRETHAGQWMVDRAREPRYNRYLDPVVKHAPAVRTIKDATYATNEKIEAEQRNSHTRFTPRANTGGLLSCRERQQPRPRLERGTYCLADRSYQAAHQPPPRSASLRGDCDSPRDTAVSRQKCSACNLSEERTSDSQRGKKSLSRRERSSTS